MYWKDKLRKVVNEVFKIDKDYLMRSEVLEKYAYTYDAKTKTYTIKVQNTTVEIRNLTSDFDVFYQVFILDEYSYAIELFRECFGRNPETLLDIGANVGYTSVYLQERIPGARLIALEPEASNFEQLEKNTASLTHFTAIKKGLWSKSGTMKINNNFRDQRAWSFHLDECGFEEVDVVSLATLVEELELPVLDMVKVDIEGAEKEVLLHDREVSAVLEKISLFCLEIHDDVVSRREIIDFLRGLGFEIYSRGETVIGVNLS